MDESPLLPLIKSDHISQLHYSPLHRIENFLHHKQRLLQDYGSYVVEDWRSIYFHYDVLRDLRIQAATTSNQIQIREFDTLLCAERSRVGQFIADRIKEVSTDLDIIWSHWSALGEDKRKTILEEQRKSGHALQRSLHEFYIKTMKIKLFFELNSYVAENLIQDHDYHNQEHDNKLSSSSNTIRTFACSLCTRSGATISDSDISSLEQKCLDIYGRIFRSALDSSLAKGDLKFWKQDDKISKSVYFRLGVKIGIVVLLVIWLFTDYCTGSVVKDRLDFWKDPGLFVFACTANILLFKLSWALDVYIWAEWDVDYISLLRMTNYDPNFIQIFNETMSMMVILFIAIIVYFRANTFRAASENLAYFSVACPLLLIIITALYLFVQRFRLGFDSPSRGLFNHEVLVRCFCAPFYPVSLRDNYAADVLTSFTKVITDLCYASCWIIRGDFTDKSNRDSYVNFNRYCSGATDVKTVATVLVLVPLWLRVLQCLRKWWDAKEIISWHAVNAGKYISSIVVVVYAFATKDQASAVYYLIVVVATLYKWWWDIVFDWKLWAVFPNQASGWCPKNVFLRPLLMYPKRWYYYGAILADLVLRFLWVSSLATLGTTSSFLGAVLPIFLGSLEILRRCLWGVFKVEVEHLNAGSEFKVLLRHDIGMLQARVAKSQKAESQKMLRQLSGSIGLEESLIGSIADGDVEDGDEFRAAETADVGYTGSELDDQVESSTPLK